MAMSSLLRSTGFLGTVVRGSALLRESHGRGYGKAFVPTPPPSSSLASAERFSVLSHLAHPGAGSPSTTASVGRFGVRFLSSGQKEHLEGSLRGWDNSGDDNDKLSVNLDCVVVRKRGGWGGIYQEDMAERIERKLDQVILLIKSLKLAKKTNGGWETMTILQKVNLVGPRLERCFSFCYKLYPLAIGATLYYSMGLTPKELVDFVKMQHEDNAQGRREKLQDFLDGRKRNEIAEMEKAAAAKKMEEEEASRKIQEVEAARKIEEATVSKKEMEAASSMMKMQQNAAEVKKSDESLAAAAASEGGSKDDSPPAKSSAKDDDDQSKK